MEQTINLKKLERDTAAVIFKSGIVEIGIGQILLVSAFAMYFDDIRYYIDVLFIVPVLFIMLGKKYVVQPRMGVVKLSRRREKRNMRVMIVITILLVLLVLLTIFRASVVVEELIDPRGFITGLIFVICFTTAHVLEFRRMYAYAFIIAGAFYLSEVIREESSLKFDNSVSYFMAGAVLIVIGIVYLIRFLQKYPIPDDRN